MPKHAVLARIVVLSLMLGTAFFGVVLTDIARDGAFRYWQYTTVFYSVIALWLSWYERKSQEIFKPITLFHEIFHWLGVNASVYLISIYLNTGVFSRFESGILVLTVLSLAVYLAGIYIDFSFLAIGLILGCFAAVVAFFQEYLYAIIIPLTIGTALFLLWHLLKGKPNPQ